MLNIQRREPDPQELIAVARRYGTVMVARAYADWSRQPEPFKGSLTAAMIDRVDCPAKQRDRIRVGTIHYSSGNPPTGALGSPGAEQNTGTYQRPWSTGHTGPLPAVTPQGPVNGWSPYQDPSLSSPADLDENLLSTPDEPTTEESYGFGEYQQSESSRQNPTYQQPYSHSPSGPLGHSGGTGPLGYASGPPGQHTGNKDFTRISARLKLRLNKTVIVVGIPGTVSRDLISSANQFVPLVPGGSITAGLPGNGGITQMSPSGNTGAMPAITGGQSAPSFQFQTPGVPMPMDALDPQFLQFLD